jgi:hypothetical protein
MPLTEIETYLFHERNSVHFITDFHFEENEVWIGLTISPDEPHSSKGILYARFPSASNLSIDEDREEQGPWPLDIIGFDCYRKQQESFWRFVLNCGSVEWSWQSMWPMLSTQAFSRTNPSL